MPDTPTPPAQPEATPENKEVVTETPKVSDELKQELKDAAGSTLKKTLIWVVGIIVAIGAAIAGVFGILYLLKGKGPIEGVKDVIQNTKNETTKADIAEKIKVAEARGAEQVIIDKLKEIKEIDDEAKQLEELNKLL
jgi:hypothetical protein